MISRASPRHWSASSGTDFAQSYWEREGKLLELGKHRESLGTWWLLGWKVLASSITAVLLPVS